MILHDVLSSAVIEITLTGFFQFDQNKKARSSGLDIDCFYCIEFSSLQSN